MTFWDLKVRCREYSLLGRRFDDSLRRFRDETKPSLNLSDPMHVRSMLTWLNCWGCRQFVKDDHALASGSIRRWYGYNVARLPSPDAGIPELSDDQLARVADAYDSLRREQASWKTMRNTGDRHLVTIGPTGAAKILHVLSPRALAPWDRAIRAELGYDGSGVSYRRYQLQVRQIATDLIDEARAIGINANDIPEIVGRTESSLPKLVDEYHWITITADKRKASKRSP
jgi:hypothetical protein